MGTPRMEANEVTDKMIKINTSMKKANVKSTIKYQVFRNKTQIKINDNCISTQQACTIEAKRSDIVEARRELQQTFEGTKQFAFLALKYRHLVAYANALKAQNHYLLKNHTITIQNIPESAVITTRQILLSKQPHITDVIQHTRD